MLNIESSSRAEDAPTNARPESRDPAFAELRTRIRHASAQSSPESWENVPVKAPSQFAEAPWQPDESHRLWQLF